MPDQPAPKARSTQSSANPFAAARPPVPPRAIPVAAWAELNCKTNYSFLEGASHPDELVREAAALGYRALAITDHSSLAGVVRAHVAAKEVGLKLLIGSQLAPLGAPPLVVWSQHRAGYGRLARLLTVGRCASEKGTCQLTLDDVATHADGLLAGVLLTPATTLPELLVWKDVFGDRLYALGSLHRGPHDLAHLQHWQQLCRETGVPLLASQDAYYHVAERRYLQDVLTAIRLGCTVAELGVHRFSNGERHLQGPDQLARLWQVDPGAFARAMEIADRCQFSLEELRYEYPEELSPPGCTPLQYLHKLTWQGAAARYPEGVPESVRKTIHHELALIEELHYEAYFLTCYDLVTFARSRGILCQGRGSAANSAVCYCLGVTSVDPARIDVLFERFISRERDEAPDIDIDFEHERREEVLQYLYDKYGRERAGMTAEVITYRPRSAVRDVGKALGLSLDRVDALAKSIDHSRDHEHLAVRFHESGFDPNSRLGRQLLLLVDQLLGFPRHLSQHVGGMVITRSPLCEIVPIENASMVGRTVIQWDKDDLDALGILKVDCLALGMLTAIRRALQLIGQHTGRHLELKDVPAEDPVVYDMISRADTLGVFQIESRAQMSMLPRLRPRCFYDLVIEVAIVRPGPIQGNMVHPYLRRRSGEEPVEYPSEAVRSVLQKTLGVPIFQEQAMRLAVVAAGFTPGQADQLRRAMGAWRRPGIIDHFRQQLHEGMLARGYTADFAERLFLQIRGFGEYGFPESHAASFALLVYVSSWIRCYYPAIFIVALLNSQPMGFYAPAQLIADVRRRGVEVRPADINCSQWDCTLEECDPNSRTAHPRWAIRLGWRMIQHVGEAAAQRIVQCRQSGLYQSYADFVHRTGFQAQLLARLAHADAFRSLGVNRRAALWESLALRERAPLYDGQQPDDPPVRLPALTSQQEVVADYQSSGLSLRDHPLAFLRSRLEEQGAVRAEQLSRLPAGRRYRVAGLVLLRQRPGTAKGITFMTIEDETGTANLIVRREIWEQFHRAARTANSILVRGELQRRYGVAHVLVDEITSLSEALGELGRMSRDFH